ncbi:MAG: bifunctional demethylmenaquinone methyltransferase/2-methoxy-6-polyprenyl-1,4-benzoquinol methylase UbiE [Coriobacteriaceae bacterium]|nr:bifunctional demethylmenaquinone methyltransferase/2-methoxy-6-polyprenyl-1,4-benzoquinol methylase UbiE [Coriobacteriaceae bacterium]
MPDRTRPAHEAGEATTERVQGIFSGIAGSYDLINALASFGIDRLWRRAVVRMSGAGPDTRVLDLCCGTGDLALAMARLARPAVLVATDFVPEMLAIAERKAARHPAGPAPEFRQADAQALPFEDASFDVVTVGFGVRNLPDRTANFREVLRVLAPGGRYVVLEFSRPPSRVFRALYHWYLRSVVPWLGGLFAHDRESYRYLNDSILRFPVQDVLARELEDAGFAEVSWRDLTFGIVAVHVAHA